MGDVHVFVDEDDLDAAQELLLVDEVESAFDRPGQTPARPACTRRRWLARRWRPSLAHWPSLVCSRPFDGRRPLAWSGQQ